MSAPAALECQIIVVEDEWLVRFELAAALEDAGATVHEVESAEQALAHIDGDAPPHILITDIRLAGAMDGWALAEAFRRAHPEGGVIYASANIPVAERQVRDSFFFSKPVSMDALVEACRTICTPHQR